MAQKKEVSPMVAVIVIIVLLVLIAVAYMVFTKGKATGPEGEEMNPDAQKQQIVCVSPTSLCSGKRAANAAVERPSGSIIPPAAAPVSFKNSLRLSLISQRTSLYLALTICCQLVRGENFCES